MTFFECGKRDEEKKGMVLAEVLGLKQKNYGLKKLKLKLGVWVVTLCLRFILL